jgi:hypothetical protein
MKVHLGKPPQPAQFPASPLSAANLARLTAHASPANPRPRISFRPQSFLHVGCRIRRIKFAASRAITPFGPRLKSSRRGQITSMSSQSGPEHLLKVSTWTQYCFRSSLRLTPAAHAEHLIIYPTGPFPVEVPAQMMGDTFFIFRKKIYGHLAGS